MPRIIKQDSRTDGQPARNRKGSYTREASSILSNRLKKGFVFTDVDRDKFFQMFEVLMKGGCSLYFSPKYQNKVIQVRIYSDDKTYEEYCDDAIELNEVVNQVLAESD